MADEEGYPTKEELERIRTWPSTDLRGWFAYIKEAGHWWPTEAFGWSEHDGIDDFKRPLHMYRISTGGWSGNEEIIQAMHENWMCWYTTWQEHRRGGHYAFSIPAELDRR
jgi:hypothetical protein